MIQSILRAIFKETVDGARIAVGGLLSHVPDPRDFRYADLGGAVGYQPKQDRLMLPVIEIKNQAPNNTCVFHSYAACREVDEGVALSPRSLVAYAKGRGYLSADGISSIRLGQQAGTEFGIAEESLVPNDNLPWNAYSALPPRPDVAANAASHKAKSYFWVRYRSEWLKALDDGHAVHCGFDWYSSYNMSGGFSDPWVLSWKRGFKVGGHAVKCCGYDLKHPSGPVYAFQNSFGPAWGDGGLFYVRMSDIHGDEIEGAVSVDLDGDTLAAFLAAHEGKDVKSAGDPGVFHIQGGKRRPYPDESTFYAFGGQLPDAGTQTYDDVSGSLLAKIPDGEPMRAEDSPFWPKLAADWQNVAWMRHPDNVESILALLSRQ